MVTFNWKDANGIIQEKSITFATDLDRLILKQGFVNDEVNVSEIKFDKNASQLYIVDKNGKESLIRPENNPLETFADRIFIYRFSALRLQKDNQTGNGATLYNTVESSMLATGGRRLQYIEITRRAVDTVRVNYRYINSSGSGFNTYHEYILKVDNGQVRFIDFPPTQTGGSYNNYRNLLTNSGLWPQSVAFGQFLQNNVFDADYESGMINGSMPTPGRLKVSTNQYYFLRWNLN